MKKFLTLLIVLTMSLYGFTQQIGCHANFSYEIDTNAMTVQFQDLSYGSSPTNPQMTATEWHWDINGETVGHTASYIYTYTTLPFTACLTTTFDTECEDTFCDSIYLEIPDICETFYVNVGYDIIEPGVCTGELTANVSNGTLPYSYNWSSYGTTQTISNLCVGDYNIVVTDANGCSFSTIGNIIENDNSGQQIDTINALPIDTCIGFTVSDAYVSNIILIDLTTIEVEWTFIDDDQEIHIFYETYTFSGTYGNYYVEISVNCDGGKSTNSIKKWGDEININSALNISNVIIIDNINLYPNPVKDVINLVYNLRHKSNITINIIDYSGKIISSTLIKSYTGNNNITLNTNDLTNGIYFVRIIADNTIKTIKFVK